MRACVRNGLHANHTRWPVSTTKFVIAPVEVKELEDLEDEAIHEPWKHASLFNDLDYPEPIVDHAYARDRALNAFKVES